MSDRVTWKTCLICGATGAVSWTTIRWATGEPFRDIPAAFVCPSGYRFSPEQLSAVFEVHQD
jgi:hypothetical protein